jgi:hypothetical protein
LLDNIATHTDLLLPFLVTTRILHCLRLLKKGAGVSGVLLSIHTHALLLLAVISAGASFSAHKDSARFISWELVATSRCRPLGIANCLELFETFTSVVNLNWLDVEIGGLDGLAP